jgi:hypothetical protein
MRDVGHVIRDIVWSKYKMDFDAVQSRLEPRSFETRRTLTIDCPTRTMAIPIRTMAYSTSMP